MHTLALAAKGSNRAAAASRLFLLGIALEGVYVSVLVGPYNLVGGLIRPAQDLGTLSSTSATSAELYLAAVATLILLSWLAYLQSLRMRPADAAAIGFAFAALFAVTLVWIYPIDALDIFDYAMQGRILAALGGNPYVDVPAAFPSDPFLPNVGWKHFPDVYGPIWTYLSADVALLSGRDLLAAVLAFKGIAAVASVACSYLAYRTTCLWQPSRAAGAVILVGWNPLVILMAGTGHNDIVMLSLVLAGIWLAASGEHSLGLWVAGLSSLIKLATAPLLPVLAVGVWVERRRRGARASAAIGAPLVLLAVTTVALYAALWPGWDRFGPLMLRGNFTASPLGLLHELLTPTLGEAAATDWMARLGDVLVVSIVIVATWGARGGLRASVRATHDAVFWMVFAVLGWAQPWYIVWIACFASLDDRPWVPALSWVAALAGLVALFDRFYLTQHWLPVSLLTHDIHTLLLVYLAPVTCAVVGPHWGTVRHRAGSALRSLTRLLGGSETSVSQQLHAIPGRVFAVWSGCLAAFVLVTRWPIRSHYLFSWDAANFAAALDDFNVVFHHPHPPGYPLYVGAAWLLRPLLGGANASFVALSLGASVVAIVLLLGLSWRLYGPRVAVLATALFAVSPNFWGHGAVAYSYAFLALGATLVAWCAVETRWGGRDMVLAGAAALGVAGGFRPDLVVFLFPVWMYGSFPRGCRRMGAGLTIMAVVVVGWLAPTIALSGGWSAYLATSSTYARAWAVPTDAGWAALVVGIAANVGQLAAFAARSFGPVWLGLLVFAAGRLFAPRALAADRRSWLLLVWMMPALGFYALVHIGNLGYLLSVLPACAIVGALAIVDVTAELTAVVPARLAAWAGLRRVLAITIGGLACGTEALLFLFSNGPVSWHEIRAVDSLLGEEVPYLAALPPDRTLVLAYDRFAQLEHYLPALSTSGRIRSLDGLLGPDTSGDLHTDLLIPNGVELVVFPDLGMDAADRPTGMRRVNLGGGVWMYEAQVSAGAHLRLGYGYARVVGAAAVTAGPLAPAPSRWVGPPSTQDPVAR